MRLSAYLASIIIFNPGVVIAASPANDEPSLSDTIHRCLNVPSFDASCLDIFATIIVIDDENQHKYDRDEQIAYFGRLKKSEKPPVISNFEMLGEIDNGAFASVTYRYVLTNYTKQSSSEVQMDAEDVWLRGPSGWSRITGVLRKTSDAEPAAETDKGKDDVQGHSPAQPN